MYGCDLIRHLPQGLHSVGPLLSYTLSASPVAEPLPSFPTIRALLPPCGQRYVRVCTTDVARSRAATPGDLQELGHVPVHPEQGFPI